MKNLTLAAEAFRSVMAGGGRPVDAIAAAAFVAGATMSDTINALIRTGHVEIVFVGQELGFRYK